MPFESRSWGRRRDSKAECRRRCRRDRRGPTSWSQGCHLDGRNCRWQCRRRFAEGEEAGAGRSGWRPSRSRWRRRLRTARAGCANRRTGGSLRNCARLLWKGIWKTTWSPVKCDRANTPVCCSPPARRWDVGTNPEVTTGMMVDFRIGRQVCFPLRHKWDAGCGWWRVVLKKLDAAGDVGEVEPDFDAAIVGAFGADGCGDSGAEVAGGADVFGDLGVDLAELGEFVHGGLVDFFLGVEAGAHGPFVEEVEEGAGFD